MVNIVQLVERQFVALDVMGSSPIIHPISILYIGLSPSGKALDFDSSIPLVRIQPAQPKINL